MEGGDWWRGEERRERERERERERKVDKTVSQRDRGD